MMRKDAPLISVFDVHVELGDTRLLDSIRLDVDSASWTEIVGPSGSGKSLLFDILSLRGRPLAGHLVFEGRNLDRVNPAELPRLRQSLGSCAESPIVLEQRTVLENLVLPFVVRGQTEVALEEAEAALEAVELSALRHSIVAELSRQQTWAVGVVRACLGDPSAIVIDSALDYLEPRLRAPCLELLKDKHLAGAAVVLLGRDFTDNVRSGTRYRIEDGVLTPLELPTIVEPMNDREVAR